MNWFNKKYLPWFTAFLLLGLVWSSAGVSVGFDFLNFDDDYLIFDRPELNPVTVEGLSQNIFATAEDGIYPMPLTRLVWTLTAALSPRESSGRLSPVLFHLLNLLLHSCNALLVFSIIRKFGPGPVAALGGAALFALHPLQVEGFVWVSATKDCLSAFFCLFSLFFYLKATEIRDNADESERDPRPFYLLAFLSYVAALTAKPAVALLPLGILALDFYREREIKRSNILWMAAWLLCALPFIFLAQKADAPLWNFTFWERIITSLFALSFYLYKILFPLNLGTDYGLSPTTILSMKFLYPMALVPLLLLGIAAFFKSVRPNLGLGFFFVLTILPTLGLISFGFQAVSVTADRYVYLSLLAFALPLARGLQLITPIFRTGILTLCIPVLFFLNTQQVYTWQNNESLFQHSIQVNPDSWLMNYNLAHLRESQGQIQDAVRLYASALRIRPDYADAHLSLGVLLGKNGRASEALPHLQKYVRLRPGDPDGYLNLAATYFRLGQKQMAERLYRHGMKIRNQNSDRNH